MEHITLLFLYWNLLPNEMAVFIVPMCIKLITAKNLHSKSHYIIKYIKCTNTTEWNYVLTV